MQRAENPPQQAQKPENIFRRESQLSLISQTSKQRGEALGSNSQSIDTSSEKKTTMTGINLNDQSKSIEQRSNSSTPHVIQQNNLGSRPDITFPGGTQQIIDPNLNKPADPNPSNTPNSNTNILLENKESAPNDQGLSQSALQDQRIKIERNLNEQSLQAQNTREEIKYILKKVFMFYASFGDRMNSDNIKGNKVYKMLQDSVLIDKAVLNKKSLDLLFCQYSKNRPSMSFDIFLSMLIKVGQMKFPNQDPKQAFMQLFEQHLKPLYRNLYAETDLGDYDVLFKEPLDGPMIAILNNVKVILQKMHQTCFPFEYQVKNDNLENQNYVKQKTETNLSSFLKDFDICPSLLTKSAAYALFVEVLETRPEQLAHNPAISVIVQPDFGNRFTLARFMTYLARLAIVGYSPHSFSRNQQEYFRLSNGDKLLLLLERLEFSLGYVNFERRMNATHNHNTKIVPSKQFLKKLSEEIGEQFGMVRLENFQSLIQKSSSGWNNNQRVDPNNFQTPYLEDPGQTGRFMAPQNLSKSNQTAISKSKRNLSANPSTTNLLCAELFEKKKESLLRIFQSHALFNGDTNSYRLNAMKYLKLLRSADLIKELSGNSHANNSGVKLSNYSKRLEESRRQNSRIGQQAFQAPNQSKIEDLRRLITPIDAELVLIKVAGSGTMKNQRSFADLTLDSFLSPLGSPNRNLNENGLALSQGKFLDFEQFLKSLEMLAEKLFPEFSIDISLSHLLDAHLSKADMGTVEATDTQINENLGVKKLVALLKDPNTVDVLSKLKESLHPYFKCYAGKTGLMTSDQFLRFCKDFGIFPDLLPKSKLIQNFSDLATLQSKLHQKSQERLNKLNAQPINQDIKNGHHFIDENLFTEVLALAAAEIEDNLSAHPIEKILFLLERMSQSSGPKHSLNIQTNSGVTSGNYFKVVGYIRKNYYKLIEDNKQLKLFGAKGIPFSYLFD